MGKLSAIFGKGDDQEDDSGDEREQATEAEHEEATEASAEPEGDAEHPPAAMPEEAAPVPADTPEVPPTYSSIEEYEATLPVPDVSSAVSPPGDSAEDS